MKLRTALGVTLVAHTILAAGVVVDARSREVDGRRWAGLTLLFGLVGVAGYLLVGRE